MASYPYRPLSLSDQEIRLLVGYYTQPNVSDGVPSTEAFAQFPSLSTSIATPLLQLCHIHGHGLCLQPLRLSLSSRFLLLCLFHRRANQ